MPPGELKKCFSAYCELHIAGPDCPGSPDVPLPCPYTSGDHASVRVPSSPWWPTHDKSCPSPTGRLSGFFQLLGIQIYSCLQKYLPANCSQACPVLVWMVPARKREWFALLRGPLAPSAGSGVALQAAFLTESLASQGKPWGGREERRQKSRPSRYNRGLLGPNHEQLPTAWWVGLWCCSSDQCS